MLSRVEVVRNDLNHVYVELWLYNFINDMDCDARSGTDLCTQCNVVLQSVT